MSGLFGTDGIRGLANQYPMTAEVAFNLARSLGYYYQNKKEKNVLIGRDTRLSGDMLEAALTAGFCSAGINVLNAGIITTPAVAYLTKYFHTTMGIVISASHNHYKDNGIKFFQENGLKLDRYQEKKIEDILMKEKYKKFNISGEMIGKVTALNESNHIYITHILDSIPKNFTIPEYKMIIDCANGASSFVAKEIFDYLKINYKIIHNTPNGININQKCGSTSIDNLQSTVIEDKADLGFAYDGDADRVLAVDEKGQLVDGDQIMVIYANVFIKEGRLGNNKIVVTYMSNLGFDEAISEMGGKVIRTDVGDKYVLEKMIDENSLLGGEQSGHIIFLTYGPHGDGIVTTFQLLNALSRTRERVSVQASRMKKYCQKLLNYNVTNKSLFLQNQDFLELKEDMLNDLKYFGRVLIRPSGTEKKIRILLESKEQKIVREWEQRLNDFFQDSKHQF